MKVADDTKKWAKRGAWLGFGLAIVCHLVPPDYRAACEFIAAACRGGL